MAFIFITKADGTQNKYKLPNNPNVRVEIGRNEDCLISLPDVIGISGLHCSIAYVDGVHIITDENSSNGTIVEGGKLKQEALQENMQYHIGNCYLSYYAEAEQAAPAPVAATPEPEAAPAGPNIDAFLNPAPTPEHPKTHLPEHKIDPSFTPASPQGKGKGKLKSGKMPAVFKMQKFKQSEAGISPAYVAAVLILSFVAGLTIRHWQETGTFLPQALFAKEQAEAPTK
ncbi:MAG: FHA domain-containing protein [Akkermansia sp.]